jgi:hypothetical protein
MQAFSVSSKYISNLIIGLNLILVLMASAPNPAFISNVTTLPFISEFYNAALAIPAFLIIVKPPFIKYLEETRKNSIK